MKIINFALILFIGIILTSCSDKTKTDTTRTVTTKNDTTKTDTTKIDNLLKHKIIKDNVYDAPIKTQIKLDVLISDTVISEQKVRELLIFLYDRVKKRTGFKYHSNPTNIYIYAYTSKEKAESGIGQWVGMISKSYDDTQPEININSIQINFLTLKPTKKFGLLESERIEIWNKSYVLEEKAQDKADLTYPLNTVEQIYRNAQLNESLNQKYKKEYFQELANECGIKPSIIDSIIVEGYIYDWPY